MAAGTEDTPRFRPGDRVDRYVIVDLVDIGGMGEIYRALHTNLGTEVALKVPRRSLVGREHRQRLIWEARTLAAVRHHHLVDAMDSGFHLGVPYLVTELLEGMTLADYLDLGAPLPGNEAADILVPVLAAIQHVHDRGFIHRDLKPSNIFLTSTGTGEVPWPKVLDFGLAQSSDFAEMLLESEVVGTPGYVPPEVVTGSFWSEAADQFALGAVLYRMLTGERAIPGGSAVERLERAAAGQVRPVLSHRPDLDQGLADVVHRALDEDLAQRFPDLATMATAMLPFASPATRLTWKPRLACGARRPSRTTSEHRSTSDPTASPSPGLAVQPARLDAVSAPLRFAGLAALVASALSIVV